MKYIDLILNMQWLQFLSYNDKLYYINKIYLI